MKCTFSFPPSFLRRKIRSQYSPFTWDSPRFRCLHRRKLSSSGRLPKENRSNYVRGNWRSERDHRCAQQHKRRNVNQAICLKQEEFLRYFSAFRDDFLFFVGTVQFLTIEDSCTKFKNRNNLSFINIRYVGIWFFRRGTFEKNHVYGN